MPSPAQQKSAIKTVLAAWLVAGTLDICSACTSYYLHSGKNPSLVLQYVASAVFGKAAYDGSKGMYFAGLLFHYIVALSFTIFFFVLYPQFYRLIKNKFVLPILFGLITWLIMSFIVLPLTHVPPLKFSLKSIEGIVILMVAIGLPVSLFSYNYYYKNQKGLR